MTTLIHKHKPLFALALLASASLVNNKSEGENGCGSKKEFHNCYWCVS